MTPLGIILGLVAAALVWTWAVKQLLRNWLPPL